MTIPADSPTAFYVCTFSMLGKLAAADGKVTRDEKRKVEEYITKTLKLDKKRRKLAKKHWILHSKCRTMRFGFTGAFPIESNC